MLHYDKASNILTMRRRSFPTNRPYNVLTDIKRSYNDYMKPGGQLEQDVKYVIDYIAEQEGWKTTAVGKMRVGPLVTHINSYGVTNDNMYYPIYCRICRTDNNASDEDASEEFELFRMPYMDDRGVLNMNTSLKRMSNFLTASEDVSYEKKEDGSGKLDVYLGSINLPISISTTHTVSVKLGKNKIALDVAIMALSAAENYDTLGNFSSSDEELFKRFSTIHNSILTYKSGINSLYSHATALASALRMRNLWTYRQYQLTEAARDNLNNSLQLDRALGRTLSRDATNDAGEVVLKAGTKLTVQNINLLKSKLVWRIYVKARPFLTDMKLAEAVPILIKAGQRVDSITQSIMDTALNGSLIVPKSVGYNEEFAEDETISDEEFLDHLDSHFYSIEGTLSEQHSEYFYNQDSIDKISVKKTLNGVSYPIDIYLDNEIITNRTFWGADINAPDKHAWYVIDKSGKLVKQSECKDEGCYFQLGDIDDSNGVNNNVSVLYHNGTVINSDDLLALYSVCGWYIANPNEHSILNKDAAFLKTINLFGDVMSRAIRTATAEFYKSKKLKIRESIQDGCFYLIRNNPFNTFYKFLNNALRTSKALEQADTLNPVSVLADTANVSTFSRSKNSVVESQRLIALPFNGRICPYETPASAKIGLVNHLASGCKIEDRRMLTAFRKVKKEGDRHYVDFDDESSVVYLDSKEQMQYHIADCLSIPLVDAAGREVTECKGKCYIGKGKILAIIPNDKMTDDVMIPETVSSDDIDLIYYAPEQHCSSTALLMPFLGADDPARISFGLSMQKQAIFCQENQRPRVLTQQYKDIFNQMDYYTIRAAKDGEVVAITSSYIGIQYDEPDAVVSDKRRASYKVDINALFESGTELEGRSFKQNDYILSTVMPGIKEDIIAPFNCTVVDVDKDKGYIKIVESNKAQNTTITRLTCKPLIISGEAATFMEYDVVVGQRVTAGQMLAHASIVREGFYAPSRNVLVAYIPTGYNYEDAVDMSKECASHYTSISASKIDITSDNRDVNFVPAQSFIHENGMLGKFISSKNVNISDVINADTHSPDCDEVTATNVSGYYYMHKKTDDSRDKNRHADHFTVTMLSFNNEKPGDKMAGRHGNKGVDSRLANNSCMPMLKNGKIIDVCLNPCGVPSRMNLGQNLEAHLGFIAEVLDLYIISDPFNGATLEEIRDMMQFTYDLCNSDPSTWASLLSKPEYSFIPKNMLDHFLNHKEHILEWKGAFNPDGTADVWDPDTQRWYANPVTIGYAYFMKLEQQVDNKVHVRAGAGIEDYAENSLQPQQGRSRGGGQKMGEMELVTLAAYGAVETLRECTNEKSDNVGKRTINTAKAQGLDITLPHDDCTSRANDVVRYLLEGIGVYVDATDVELWDNVGFTDNTSIKTRNRLSNYNKAKIVRDAENKQREEIEEDTSSYVDELFDYDSDMDPNDNREGVMS